MSILDNTDRDNHESSCWIKKTETSSQVRIILFYLYSPYSLPEKQIMSQRYSLSMNKTWTSFSWVHESAFHETENISALPCNLPCNLAWWSVLPWKHNNTALLRVAQSSVTKQLNALKAKTLLNIWLTESLLSHTIQPPADTVYCSFYATWQQDAYVCAIPANKHQLEYWEDIICTQSDVDKFFAAQPSSVYSWH